MGAPHPGRGLDELERRRGLAGGAAPRGGAGRAGKRAVRALGLRQRSAACAVRPPAPPPAAGERPLGFGPGRGRFILTMPVPAGWFSVLFLHTTVPTFTAVGPNKTFRRLLFLVFSNLKVSSYSYFEKRDRSSRTTG